MPVKSVQAKKLFVREGEDLVFQNGTANGGFRTTVYRHCENQMRVVLCRVPGPLCSMNIYVPTIANDNKGLPHTLEHLVFCGSKRHPNRGYLDALANCSFSTGTNAWTAEDHTCYTLSAAGEEAIANVLPVFLDHVLHPLLTDNQFITEVFHFDATGKEQGVVFSEMVARENSEEDLMDLSLRRLMFSKTSAYGFETGGLVKDIATLTNQDIIEYHRKFYDANNATVVLVGSFSDEFEQVIQNLPAEMVASLGCDSRKPMDCSAPASGNRSEYVKFPSAETDFGSFAFGWRGPLPDDVETLTAIEILMAYLAENASSPLTQRFVERPAPLAGYLFADVRMTLPSSIILSLSSVPYTDPNNPDADSYDNDDDEHDDDDDDEGDSDAEDDTDGGEDGEEDDPDIPMLFAEGHLERLLLEELRRIHDSRFDGNDNALVEATKRFRQKLAASIEDNPLDVMQEVMQPDIVAAHFSPAKNLHIGTRANVFDVIDKLAQKTVEFWLGLLQWLIDEPIYHVAMVPDPDLNSQIEAERQEIERKNERSIADKDKHTKMIEAAVQANKVDIPDNLKQSMPVPDASRISGLPHSHRLIDLDKPIGPARVIQLIEVDSDFPEFKLHVPLTDLSDELRAYLVLFQELLLGTDLVLPAGVEDGAGGELTQSERRIDHVEFDNHLADITTLNGAAIGYQNEIFSCSWLDELFNIYVRAPQDKLAEATRCIIHAMMFADFTADRILTVAQNLLSEIVELKRNGDQTIVPVMTLFTTQDREELPRWVDNHISIFEQEQVLQCVVDELKANNMYVIEKLNQIQRFLVDSSGGFLSLSAHRGHRDSSMEFIEDFGREWQNCYEKFGDQECRSCRNSDVDRSARPFPFPRHIRFPDLVKPLRMHVTMPTLQASNVQISFCCNLFRQPTTTRPFGEQLAELPALDFYALELLADLVQRVDGPLYNAIRGKGYAYGAYFQQYMWTGMFVFGCSSASDAPKAILEMRSLVASLDEYWNEFVTDFEINMTRSSIVYGNASLESTPDSVIANCITSNICGFESATMYNLWREKHISAVRQTDLRRVYEQYLKKFADPEYPSVTVILTPPETELPPELGEFEHRTLDSL